jgi:hypothetical protein
MAGMARFSPCGTWRYCLERAWDADRPRLVFILLNPSTADERMLDPTVAGCLARAADGGYGSLRVLNLFALRATDPAALRRAADPVGPGNDAALREGCAGLGAGDRVICGWGNHGAHLGRSARVLGALRAAGLALHHLGLTLKGEPRHPLYVRRALAAQPWTPP